MGKLKVKTPVGYIMRMINTIGDHNAVGWDEKWVKGMLKHWLPKLAKIVQTADQVEEVKKMTQSNVYPAVKLYLESLPKRDDYKWLIHDMDVIGLYSITDEIRVKHGIKGD